jgi:hypothetical protein
MSKSKHVVYDQQLFPANHAVLKTVHQNMAEPRMPQKTVQNGTSSFQRWNGRPIESRSAPISRALFGYPDCGLS